MVLSAAPSTVSREAVPSDYSVMFRTHLCHSDYATKPRTHAVFGSSFDIKRLIRLSHSSPES